MNSAQLLSQFGWVGSRISRTQVLRIMTAAIFFGTALLGITFIQAPWQENRHRLEGKHQEEIQRSELMMSLNSLHRQLSGLEKEMLLQGGTPVLTSKVTGMASDYGLEIESVTPKQGAALGKYWKVQIEVRATAAFQELVMFLQAVERHRPVLLVSEIELDRSGSPSTMTRPPTPTPSALPGTPAPTFLRELDPERQRIRLTVGALTTEGAE